MTPPMMPGSAIVPPLVRQRLPDLSGTAAKLAIALSGYVNGKTGDAFPSNKLLMRDAGITSWETFRHARKELAGCGLTWTAGKGDRLTVYRWNGVSPKIGESPIFGVSESPEIGDSDLTVQVTAQQEQPTSRHASHAGAKAKRAPGRRRGRTVCGAFGSARTETPGTGPLRIGPDLGAARELGRL